MPKIDYSKTYIKKSEKPLDFSDGKKIGTGTYLLGKLGSGVVSGFVGTYNLIAGGIDQLTGNTYRAQKRYANDFNNQMNRELDEAYGKEATGATKFASGALEGVGQNLPRMAISFIPVVGAPIAAGLALTGYTGQGVSEAYNESGRLGGKEYLYGVATGTMDTVLETVAGKAGGWLGNTGAGKLATSGLGKIGEGAAKAATKVVGAGAGNIIGKTVAGGASEFAEEFIEAYAEVGLKRALDIDPNASVTFGEALYAGAVGFASGGILSGGTAAVNTAAMRSVGKKIQRTGEQENVYKLGKEIASSFSPEGKIEGEFAKGLDEQLKLYDSITDKNSDSAAVVLGNINAYAETLRAYAQQRGDIRKIISNPEKFLPYVRALFGNNITAEELKNPDSKYVRYIAAANWATGATQAIAIKQNRNEFVRQAEMASKGLATVPGVEQSSEWNGDTAYYKMADGRFANVYKGGNGYTVLVSSIGLNGKLDTDNASAVAIDDKGTTVYGEEEVRDILSSMREDARTAQAQATEEQVEIAEEATEAQEDADTESNATTEAENGLANGEETEEEEPKREEPVKEEKKKIKLTEVKGGQQKERLLSEYKEATIEKSRKIIGKAYDTLSAEKRIAIAATIESAEQEGVKVDEETLKAACIFEAGRSGLSIIFNSELPEGKLGLRQMIGAGYRVVATSRGVKSIRETVAHEIFHDIFNTRAGKRLGSYALSIATNEDIDVIAERYSKEFHAKNESVPLFSSFFKDGKYESKLDAVLDYDKMLREKGVKQSVAEEIAAKMIGAKLGTKQFMSRLAGESNGKAILSAFRRMGAFLRAKKDAKPMLLEVNRLENLYLKAVEQAGVIDRVKDYVGEGQQFNLATWEDKTILTEDGVKSGKEILFETLKKNGWRKEESEKLIEDVQSVADVVKLLRKNYKVLDGFAEIKPHYRNDGSLMLSCVVKNGEYELNVDFTTICKRREALARFLSEYVESGHDFGKKGFDKASQAYLENMFRKYGLDTACSICFVEARRKNVDTWSAKFVRLWNEALKYTGMTANTDISAIEELKGIDVINGITDDVAFAVASAIEGEALAESEAESVMEESLKEAPVPGKPSKARAAYIKYYNERRAGGKKASPNTLERMLQYISEHQNELYAFKTSDLVNTRVISYVKAKMPDLYSIFLTSYGANSPKQTLPATPYAADAVLDSEFKKREDLTAASIEMGGVRLNSFSDFQITRVLDYFQLVADLTARGSAVQTYTKELAMVELFGLSGLKINMSLVPEIDMTVDKNHAGLNAAGEYILSADSADAKKAFELQERDGMKGDVGTVLVGISKYQIIKALNDDRIKMIIPYHSSGMPKHLRLFYNHDLYTDYQKVQSTRQYNTNNGKTTLGAVEGGDPFMKVFYGYYTTHGGDYIGATKAYLDHCKEKGLFPRFAMEWDKNKSFEENINSEGNYIVSNPNYYKVLIDFTSDAGDGKFKQQKAVRLNIEGVDVKGIVERESKLLEESIRTYEEAKGNMFEEFQQAVNGTLKPGAIKADRDARIAEENGKYAVDDVNLNGLNYSYNALTKKKDLQIIELQDELPTTEKGDIDKKAVVNIGRLNALKQKNTNNTDTNIYVRVDDIGKDVLLSKNGMIHGIARSRETALAVMQIGDVLKNSIAVNELNGSESRNTEMSYVLLCACRDKDNIYVVRSVVSKLKNDVIEIDVYQLGAVKGKKTEIPTSALGGTAVTEQNSLISSGSTTISVADFLEYVKTISLANEIFSEDVAKNIGISRSEGSLSEDLRFDLDISDTAYLSAVERGDMETAQRMVVEKAKITFPNTKIVDEDGKPLIVWHGTDESFNVFDMSKVRANMDIQGAFFSPWKEDAEGYGSNVRKFFLNIDNPSSEGTAYKALNSHKGENNAGIKARNDLIKAGYDGVNNSDEEFVAFYPDQIKSADPVTYDDNGNVIPLSQRFNSKEDDIRFDLATEEQYDLTPEQVKANRERAIRDYYSRRAKADKWYRKGDVRYIADHILSVISSDLSDQDVLDKVRLSGKDRNAAIDYFTNKLNTTSKNNQGNIAREFARYIMNHAVVESIITDDAYMEEVERAERILNVLGSVRHNIDLSTLKENGEIKYMFDDKAGGIYLQWQASNGRGVGVDQVATMLAEEGVNIYAENEADIFKEIMELYKESRGIVEGVKEKMQLSAYGNEYMREEVLNKTANRILAYLDETGVYTDAQKALDRNIEVIDSVKEAYNAKISDLQESLASAIIKARSTGMIAYIAKDFADTIQKRTGIPAGKLDMPEATAAADLARKVWDGRSGKIDSAKAREVCKILQGFYTPAIIDGESYQQGEDGEHATMYNQSIADAIANIASGEGDLTAVETAELLGIMRAIRHLYRTFDTAFFNGKRESITKKATEEIKTQRSYIDYVNKKTESAGKLKTFFSRAGKFIQRNYLYGAVTPRQVIQSFEYYDKDGVMTQIFEDIQNGYAASMSDYADMMKTIIEYVENHKGLEKHLTKETVNIMGADLTFGQAISLLLTARREQAVAGLETNGFTYMGIDGIQHHIPGVGEGKIDDLKNSIETALTSEDKEYIKIVNDILTKAGEMKKATDNMVFGFTNVEGTYYYPIRRSDSARAIKVTDVRQLMSETAVLGSGQSFNKRTVKGANAELMIDDVTSVVSRHANGVSLYANLYSPMQTWDRVWNKNVDGETVRRLVNENQFQIKGKMGQADFYLRNLFRDVQGIKDTKQIGDEVFANLRASFVSATLGINLSSTLKQMGSFGTALVYLNPTDLVHGLAMRAKKDDVFKYSKVANGRMFDKSRIVDQSANTTAGEVKNAVRKFGNITTLPVEMMDNQVVFRLWNACRYHVMKNSGFALDTEENMIEAGKLLDKVVRETQSTSTPETRSAFQRSANPIMQTFTMFTSDAVKQVSNIYEGIMRVKTANMRKQMGIGSEAEVKSSWKFLGRANVGLVSATAITVAVIEFIKWALKKDREDSVPKELALTTMGEVIGYLPFISTAYSAFFEGYDVDNFFYDNINGLIDSTKQVSNVLKKVSSGEAVESYEYWRPFRKLCLSVADISGIPARNANKYATSLAKSVIPKAGYWWDDNRLNGSAYGDDLDKLIASGSERKALAALDLSIKNGRTGEVVDTDAASEMVSLLKSGYDVLGNEIPTTYTIDGSRKKTTQKQYKQMQKVYAGANSAVKEIVASEIYEGLPDEERADAIKRAYNSYLSRAKEEALGIEGTKASVMLRVISNGNLFSALAHIANIEGDDDEKRSDKVAAYLNSLKLSKEEKYCILYAAGYHSASVIEGVSKAVKKSEKLSEEEKQEVLQKLQ